MNVWGPPDRSLVSDDAAALHREPEDLVDQIAHALAAAGEYVTRIDLRPTQVVVDFNWAAHQAGRRLGIRVDVDLQVTRSAPDGKVQVRVTPTAPPD